MARAVVVQKSLATASANAIALSQTPVSGTALTLNGASVTGGVATLDTARRVLLTYGSEGSARTLIVNGTNGTGAAISETLAVPSGAPGTVATLQDFLTVTSAVPAGGGYTAAVTLGTNATGSTAWQVPNQHVTPFQIGFECDLLSGAATFSIETTNNSPLAPLPIYQAGYSTTLPVPNAFPVTGLTALTGNAQGSVSGVPIAAWRLTVTAGTGSVQATAQQAGIAGP